MNNVKAFVLKNSDQWIDWKNNIINQFKPQANVKILYNPQNYPIIVAYNWDGEDDKEITVIECEKTKSIKIKISEI